VEKLADLDWGIRRGGKKRKIGEGRKVMQSLCHRYNRLVEDDFFQPVVPETIQE
jgi:hypothetical protein